MAHFHFRETGQKLLTFLVLIQVMDREDLVVEKSVYSVVSHTVKVYMCLDESL